MPAPMKTPEPSVLQPNPGPRFGIDDSLPALAEPVVEAGPVIEQPSAGPKSRPIGFRPPRPVQR
jgi:hypothetical protein